MPRFDFSVIRTLRRKHHMSADELAQKANLTRGTVLKIETGESNPTITTLEALANVFQIASSELVRLAEITNLETAEITPFEFEGIIGTNIRFPNFETNYVKAKAGAHKVFDPQHHENTAEVCMVLSGSIVLVVGDQSIEMGPRTAVRFKAMHYHHYDVIEDAEILLIHHTLV